MDLVIRENLKVVYFTRHGSSTPFFALREFDTKILRTPLTREKGSLRVQGVSEQAIRARITQVIMKLKLLPVKGLKSEVKVLKQRGILGKRAPKCSLLSANDMVNLLRAFGRESYASDLDAAIKNLKKKTPAKKSEIPESQRTPKANSALRPRKECTVKRTLSFSTSSKRIKAYPSYDLETSLPKRIKVSNLSWSSGSIGSPTGPFVSPFAGFKLCSNKSKTNSFGPDSPRFESGQCLESTQNVFSGENPNVSGEAREEDDFVFAPSATFDSPSPPTPSIPVGNLFTPRRRIKNRAFPVKNSCKTHLFSSPNTDSRKNGDDKLDVVPPMPPLWDGICPSPFNMNELKLPSIQEGQTKFSPSFNHETLFIPSSLAMSQSLSLSPPPLLNFNFDVNLAITEIMDGLETTSSRDLLEYESSNKIQSPLPSGSCSTGIEEECEKTIGGIVESEQSSSTSKTSMSVPVVLDSVTASETDAYLATCRTLQPIAQIS